MHFAFKSTAPKCSAQQLVLSSRCVVLYMERAKCTSGERLIAIPGRSIINTWVYAHIYLRPFANLHTLQASEWFSPQITLIGRTLGVRIVYYYRPRATCSFPRLSQTTYGPYCVKIKCSLRCKYNAVCYGWVEFHRWFHRFQCNHLN
jgi:hypothetical protein